jgi:SAM-dependent methyltransferase
MEAVAACPLCGEAKQVEVVSYPELSFARCVGCSLVYKRAQRSSLGRGYESAYFEQGGARYLERFEHRVRKCRNQLLAALEFAPTAADLLDVGCSTGYVLEAGRRLGLRAVGADTSEFAVRTCRERGYAAEVGQLTALPFADASFDVVTAKHTLEHSAQPLQALRELRRVLRPGGVVFLIVPDVEYWKETVLRRSGSYYRPDRLGWQHAVYYSDATLARACAAAGLAPVHAGKAIYRSRLARGPRATWEGLRVAGVKLWNETARALHLRREIQLIARRAPERS